MWQILVICLVGLFGCFISVFASPNLPCERGAVRRGSRRGRGYIQRVFVGKNFTTLYFSDHLKRHPCMSVAHDGKLNASLILLSLSTSPRRHLYTKSLSLSTRLFQKSSRLVSARLQTQAPLKKLGFNNVQKIY